MGCVSFLLRGVYFSFISIMILGFFLSATRIESIAEDSMSGKSFNIEQDDDFKDYKDVIKRLVDKRHSESPNDFCLIGYIASDKSKFVWVFWQQKNEIILWEPGEIDLALSRRKINLQKDVVGTEGDLHGSTYLVTRAWVDNFVANCDKNGTKLHLEKSKHSLKH